MVMAFRPRTALQRDQVGLAPVVQLPVPVGLAPVPQEPSQPLLGKSLLDPVYGAQRPIQGLRHLGDAQPSSLLSRIRALAVTRAELFPTRIRCCRSSRCSSPAAPRTYHGSSPLPPPSTLHPQQYTATGQVLAELSTSRLTEC